MRGKTIEGPNVMGASQSVGGVGGNPTKLEGQEEV